MIVFDESTWTIGIPPGESPIARQYDNLTRSITVTGAPDGWDWTLLVQASGKLDIIDLEPVEGGVGVTLTAQMLALSGFYTIQLRGTQGELVRHTNVLQVLVPKSLSGDATWPTVPSAVEQLLQQMEELNQHPPYPGDNGYWMVWDLDSGTYVESQLPLPPVAEGPPGKAATITVGETVMGEPGTPASVQNTGTENAAVLRFTIPRGTVGPTGATPQISVEVNGLPEESEPTVQVSGTPENPIITLGIPAGKTGATGDPGSPGTPGQTPNIEIGTIETLPAGSSVTASITGQTPNLVLNLGIPKGQQGDPGQAATVTVGTTTTGAPGSQASVVNSGTESAAVLNFTIPAGQTGMGIPPTDTAKDGDVPTFRDGDIVWEPLSDGDSFQDWTEMYNKDIVIPDEEPVAIIEDALIGSVGTIYDLAVIIKLPKATDSSYQVKTFFIDGLLIGDHWGAVPTNANLNSVFVLKRLTDKKVIRWFSNTINNAETWGGGFLNNATAIRSQSQGNNHLGNLYLEFNNSITGTIVVRVWGRGKK